MISQGRLKIYIPSKYETHGAMIIYMLRKTTKAYLLTFIRDSLPFISDNLTKRSNSHGNPTKVVLFLTGYFDQLVLGKLYTFPEVLHAHFMNPTNWLATLLRKKNFANNI